MKRNVHLFTLLGESTLTGQLGKQMREVRGWEDAAMCTKGYCARRPAPH